MSVQAGIWNFDGRPVDRKLLADFSGSLKQSGPDGESSYVDVSIGMLYRPFHTTTESRREQQPYFSRGGFVLTWDGRLDNRDELIAELACAVSPEETDLEIAAAAYEQWGADALRRFVGDWALALWQPAEKALILARDYAAIRHLYYWITSQGILWCTHLDPIVLLSKAQFTLCEEYVASYIVAYPDAQLTPYREILAVPPGKLVKIHNGGSTVHSHWVFGPNKLEYATDSQYEEHFRWLFRRAVRRRLRSDSPILADLSGGFDSTSIVCMADDILSREGAQTPRIDTLSIYDPTEPEGDDLIYLTQVEKKRGRIGFHIDISRSASPISLECTNFTAAPNLDEREEVKAPRRALIDQGGYRVCLSGLGGDEFNGQAADLRVVMADLIAQCRFLEFAKQLKAWSLLMRRPWIHVLLQTIVQLLPVSLRLRLSTGSRLDPWINASFRKQIRLSQRRQTEYEGPRLWLPGQRDWAVTLRSLSNQFASEQPRAEEKRYPYLDRDLFEFLASIPGEQLLRPGYRRSLMRRALVDILPSEILSRQTKAGAARCFVLMAEHYWPRLEPMFDSLVIAQLRFVDALALRDSFIALRSGCVSPNVVQLIRALALEIWLRNAIRVGVLSGLPANVESDRFRLDPLTA
jgi:asparagine synthase (glutamine-hydrolysing)